MFNMQQIKKILQSIQVVRSPKHRLSTFGSSRIHYQLVTDVPGFSDRTRLREGIVTADKPAIITPQTVTERFEGFGSDVKDFVDTLVKQYGQAFRGLEYQFRNEMLSTRIELKPLPLYLQDLTRQIDQSDSHHNALIAGSDHMWELAVMKFIVEETMASFSINIQELNERGFFNGEERHRRSKRREIDQLFRQAKTNKSVIPALGAKLKEYGLFERYQDAFFRLVN